MKQSMLHIFRGTAAKESLVDDAVKTNETAETTDPVQAQNNVDFQEEIKRLKDLKNDAPAEGGDAPPADGDAPPVEGDDAKPAEDDKPTEETDEKPADGEEEVEPVETTDEESEESPEEATDVKPVKDLETATEALHFAIESLRLVRHAHDVGVVRPYHVNMVLEGISHHSKRYGFSSTGFATEADAPDSSMGKVKLVAGKVAEFIRNLIKQIREYFGKVLAWLKEAYRGYKGQEAQFEKNTDGMMKRLKYLQGQTIDQDKLDKAVEAKTIQLTALTYGDENNAKNVSEGVRSLCLVSEGIIKINDNIQYHPFLAALTGASDGNEVPLKQAITIITPENAMKWNGSSSLFGNDKTIHSTFSVSNGDVQLANMIGGVSYKWSLADSAPASLQDAITTMRQYNFTASKENSDNGDFKPLRSVKECIEVMGDVAKLSGMLNSMIAAQQHGRNSGDAIAQFIPKMVAAVPTKVSDELKLKQFLSVIAAVPDAFTKLIIGPCDKNIKHLTNVIQQLQRWINESMDVIASAVASKP